ncbi:MAG TPA: exo-beta-N-acetylmuramidase NamZ domain-containing protein [Vicinamibacterales bacterium]|nr:exo-beta-N-acetylmuramidase NamZ domain-containing protein [Vicinamibacterales bacterium]
MKNIAFVLCVTLTVLGVSGVAQQQRTTTNDFDLKRLEAIEPLIKEEIAAKKLPGAVVLVGRGDRIVWQRVVGNRAVEPKAEPMTADTIFDLASLTKVVATTTAAMILIEEGKIRLSDRVATYIPGFERYNKGNITVRHLMTHMAGLRPDVDLGDLWTGYDKAIELAIEEVPTAPPGERFVYSDIGYFLLGDIVRRVSGQPLDEFTRDRIFKPLGMNDTMFKPPASLLRRIAPTENCTPYGWPCDSFDSPDGALAQGKREMSMLRGVVHDPTARRMAGVAGHAGLFSTAADLSIFVRMLLNGGSYNGVRILSPLAVDRLISPSTPPGERNVRGLGWDMDSTFSSNRGELLPIGSFGHTGWTGTSLWMDPATKMFVVFLSNRNHPDGKGDVTPLRARVSTIAASALTGVTPELLAETSSAGRDFGPGSPVPAEPASAPVLTGIDVLRADGFAILRGKRVGLVTNHTGRARDGATTIDLIHQAKEVKLVALFSPEHGIRGILDAKVPSERDEKTGLVIHSLYGETRRPTDEMLKDVDTLVFDLQDIGARFYTYTTTMAYVMEEAAKRKIGVVVLDRVNPINGVQIEGPELDKSQTGFTGYFPAMPIRHGMTLGELAQLFNAENRIGADLTVVRLRNWTRDQWFDSTAQPWINPSPNMRNLIQATLYPGIGAIEGTNISVGRGTDTPFEQIGAPWIDGVKLAEALNARNLAGIRFYPVRFTPTASKHANEECQGVFMVVTDRIALRPVRVGAEIAAALSQMHGSKYQIEAAARLFGSSANLAALKAGGDPAALLAGWSRSEARWRLLRAKYLIYR